MTTSASRTMAPTAQALPIAKVNRPSASSRFSDLTIAASNLSPPTVEIIIKIDTKMDKFLKSSGPYNRVETGIKMALIIWAKKLPPTNIIRIFFI